MLKAIRKGLAVDVTMHSPDAMEEYNSKCNNCSVTFILQYCNQFTNNKDTICSLKNHGKKCLLAIKRLYTKHNFCRFHFFFFSILFCLLVLESVSSQIPVDGLTSGVFSVLAYLAYTCTFFNQCIWYS